MPIIIVDGPEKAGKTTFIKGLGQDVGYRHWGPVSTPIDYIDPLLQDMRNVQNHGSTIVWDRSWASELVYNKLLQRRATDMETLMYLERGPWARYMVKIMLLPPSRVLEERRAEARDHTDHPVNPSRERSAYLSYANKNNWQIIEG